MEDLSFYNPENSILRKAQLRMLKILDLFVNICEKHNIDYWLHAGTALGAHRHGGFIPWDDDLDVVVLQKDYKKLCAILEKELPPNLKLQTRKTDKNFPLRYAKIRDLNSVFNEPNSENYKYRGIFIDIFPMVNVPSRYLKKIIDSILSSPHSYSSTSVIFKKLKYIILMLFIPIANLTLNICNILFGNKKTNLPEYSYGMQFYDNHEWSHFYPLSKTTFEGKKYNVPGNLERYLTFHFGNDYMTIPQKDKRIIHANEIEFLQ